MSEEENTFIVQSVVTDSRSCKTCSIPIRNEDIFRVQIYSVFPDEDEDPSFYANHSEDYCESCITQKDWDPCPYCSEVLKHALKDGTYAWHKRDFKCLVGYLQREEEHVLQYLRDNFLIKRS